MHKLSETELEDLKHALSVWQLCQIQSYFDEKGDRWHVGVLRRCIEQFTRRLAEDIGTNRLAKAMAQVWSIYEDRSTDETSPVVH